MQFAVIGSRHMDVVGTDPCKSERDLQLSGRILRSSDSFGANEDLDERPLPIIIPDATDGAMGDCESVVHDASATT